MNRRTFLKAAGRASITLGASLYVPRLGTTPAAVAGGRTHLSQQGTWRFHLDPDNVGREFEAWYQLPLSHQIQLPGSTDEAGYGTRTTGPEFGHLSRAWRYQGLAWYQRDVDVPLSWRGKRIMLFLERPHWATTVWVDDQEVGTQNSLSVPHVHDLTGIITPGRHTLTICVDNNYLIDVGRNAHSVTDHTQTNWNGITGRIELQATDPVWIDHVRTFPDLAGRRVRLEGTIRNITGTPVDAEVAAVITGVSTDHAPPHRDRQRIGRIGEEGSFSLTVPMGDDVSAWDEFAPTLYRAEVLLTTSDGTSVDPYSTTFGMREIGTDGTRFVLNGRPIFLRGNLECCIFPRTGYPPTEVSEWARVFETARSYGLNHVRFHSWCPPEAAFLAADEAGILLHVELPVWNHQVGSIPNLDAFMRAEGERIQDAYGNHPSFTMMALGNELLGDWSFMNALLADLKERDPRRLYTAHADHRRMKPEPASDYYIGHHTAVGYLRIHNNDAMPHPFQRPYGTDFDFREHVAGIDVPAVSHENGQWAVNPDYSELEKYTGPLEPRNLVAFRDRLAARGMLDQAGAMQQATGRFSWILYKEDIESCLRTPNFGGFQLLQLQDFPGQGEALIGLLDAFWDTKGIFTPKEFRQFCSATVPLLRMEKFVWTTDETYTATAQINHHGPELLRQSTASWMLRDDAGAVLASGRFDAADIGFGLTTLGRIEVPLALVTRACRCTVTVALPEAEAMNSWDLWVYPSNVDTTPSGDVLIATTYDADVRGALMGGRKVLLLSPPDAQGPLTLPLRFLPVFWSLSWFLEQPGTSSILCDPDHPALAAFPTDAHTNWQWQEVLDPSQAFILDETPPDYRPLVQVVDDFHRNHKLGAVIETRVGMGSLVACGLNLQDAAATRPVARQLLHSLLAYMQSDRFAPAARLDESLLRTLLT